MQSSIVLLVDVEALLEERKVENNAYLIDDTQRFRFHNQEAQPRTTYVRGALAPDSSQASSEIMNWAGFGIAAAPRTIPKAIFQRQYGSAARSSPNSPPLSTTVAGSAERHWHPFLAFPRTVGAERKEGDMTVADTSPVIIDITGPAVDNYVIYPAQYGSPDFHTDGWYWSATVDVHKIGVHVYFIDFLVYRPIKEGNDAVVWTPERYALEAKIDISFGVVRNGFTGYGPGVLPLIPEVVATPTVGEEGVEVYGHN
jgi:hypothetical protein